MGATHAARFRRRRLARAAALAAVAALVGAPGVAAADGYTLRLEPGYSATETSQTDAAGNEVEGTGNSVLQKYGLTVEKSLWPNLRFGTGVLLDWLSSRSEVGTAPPVESDTKRWRGYARLDLGSRNLRGSVGYDRTEEISRSEVQDRLARVSTYNRLIREGLTASGQLTAEGLPLLELRLSRTDTYDVDRAVADLRVDEFVGSAAYAPVPWLDLRYSLRADWAEDRRSGTETDELSNALRAVYQASLLERRLSVYASLDASRLDSTTTVTGVGGVVTERQIPVRGLSAVEVFPQTPERVVLESNPALVDGNTGGGAGLDIGYGRTAAGDRQPRDLGVQFADDLTPVNRLQVWVDRFLPQEVASAYAWAAYQSDDNLDWTPVPVTGPVVFGALLQNRFEIPIAETRARYLKVVVSPLALGVTLDPPLAEVLITELETLRVRPAEAVRGDDATTQGAFSGGVRYQFASVPGLTYDLSTFLRDGSERSAAWSVTNGLAYLRQLRPTTLLTARLDHTDTDEGRGRESANRYAVTLAATPLPTLGASAAVNGSYTMSEEGDEIRNSAVMQVTADLYRGVAVSGNGSASYGTNADGRHQRSLEGRFSTNLAPHRTLSMSATFASTDSRLYGAGQQSQGEAVGRLEGAASFTPVPALYLNGTVTRYLWGLQAPSTFASFGGTFSPLPGSPLLLRFNWQESRDTFQDLRTRIVGPSLRWNIRPKWTLDVSYTHLDSVSPTVESHARVFFAKLLGLIGS